MENGIRRITDEIVRARPALFIGNNGVVGLLRELITACIEVGKPESILFSVIINGNNDYSFRAKTGKDLSLFFEGLADHRFVSPILYPRVLVVLSRKIECIQTEDEVIMNFELDEGILKDPTVDYQELSEAAAEICLLNRHVEILLKDTQKKFINQSYYHFPEGVFHLFEKEKRKASGKPGFAILFDGEVGENNYQIALGYRTDWCPQPVVKSYANNVCTIGGGSLVEGILEGVIAACESHFNLNNLTSYKITRSKIYNGLILVCSVRGGDFQYGGSFKEILDDENVKLQSRELMQKLVCNYIESNKENAEKFLWRFDEIRIGSQVF